MSKYQVTLSLKKLNFLFSEDIYDKVSNIYRVRFLVGNTVHVYDI